MMSESDAQATDACTTEIGNVKLLPERPLVSVYMTAYNHDRYIAQAIEGVISQRAGFSIELIIGEDCSTDRTSEIICQYQQKYPELIRIITSPHNVGPFLNARRCRERCNGNLIARLDGDDYWLPGKLDRQISYLAANPDCVAVYTNAVVIDDEGEVIGLFNNWKNEKITLSMLLRCGNFLNNSSMVHRAKFMPLLLQIDSPFIDYRAHFRLAKEGFLAQLGQPLTVYRINRDGGMMSNSNNLVRGLYWEAVVGVPRDLVSDKDFARGVADFLKRTIYKARKTHNFKLVKEWAPRVFEASPYGTIRTGLLVCWLVMRAMLPESKDKLFFMLGIRHRKILFRC